MRWLAQGDRVEAKRYVKRLLQMGVSVGCVTATAILLGRNVLPQLFSPDPSVIAAAATALPIVAASMVRVQRHPPFHSAQSFCLLLLVAPVGLSCPLGPQLCFTHSVEGCFRDARAVR